MEADLAEAWVLVAAWEMVAAHNPEPDLVYGKPVEDLEAVREAGRVDSAKVAENWPADKALEVMETAVEVLVVHLSRVLEVD